MSKLLARLLFALLACAALWNVASPAAAQTNEKHRLRWRSDWRPFEWVDVVQTTATAGVYVYVQFFYEPADEPKWRGPILFDGAVRDALVAESRDGRNRAADVSDVFWYVPMVLPFAESVIVPLGFDDWNWDIAWELTAMNLQAASVNALLTRVGHRIVLRERPDTEPCNADPDYDKTCFGGPNASFPSGHGAAALMGAGLSCAHHSNLPLYGGGFADAAVCAVALAMGMTSNIARLYADRHYATDAIAGAVIGLGSGFGMPVLLHYHGVGSFDEPNNALAVRWTFLPLASDDTLGLGMYGWF